jgi:urease accessory protein
MRRLTKRIDRADSIDATLTLSFDLRQRSRFRARLSSGEPVGIVLDRGHVLRHGDLLGSEDGFIVEVRAADEPLSKAVATDPHAFARACYHLGNRHVPLAIDSGGGVLELRYRHDHVLDDMVRGLGGLDVTSERAAFEPEPGAYGAHAHHHGAHAHGAEPKPP